jgi:N-methylhydantoinase B/oxoprolinase/acetone carboxylase alpha subunit
VRELEFLEPVEVTILADRRKRGPYGLQGGGSGAPGTDSVSSAGEVYTKVPSKTRLEIKRGEKLRIETPGGGGWGTAIL